VIGDCWTEPEGASHVLETGEASLGHGPFPTTVALQKKKEDLVLFERQWPIGSTTEMRRMTKINKITFHNKYFARSFICSGPTLQFCDVFLHFF